MSNALRKFQKRKSTKPRRGLNTRGRPRGPVRAEPVRSPPRMASVPDGPADLTKADPACRRCHGTGWGPTIVGKNDHRTKLICACVSRGMAGGAPWLRKKKT